MFPKYRPPTFEGDYFVVGYQHAEWWARYLRRKGCEDYHAYFRRRLARSWQPRFKPLFRNTLDAYPEIILEILGMSQALTDAGYKTSPLHVFANCLGETGHQGSQCTAFVAFNGGTAYLAHNEEESEVCPLCICRVAIRAQNRSTGFLTASYPFQLFGSAFGGVNKHIAFQGNSIGYAKHAKSIEASWEDRLPKTVFTRKWLECGSLEQALEMCSMWLFSLPNHNYFLANGKAYSVEIRPFSRYKWRPLDQATLTEIKELHCHTNQFIRDDESDEEWLWKYDSDRKESFERLLYLKSAVSKRKLFDEETCKKKINLIAMHHKYKHKSSSSFVISSNEKARILHATAQFNALSHELFLE